jgi:hypothetical protein
MKHTQKTKAKRAGAKKTAATAAASTRRATVKEKPRKQSVSVGRKMLDQIPVMPVSVEPIMSHLFWPALPFAMMRMWWGTGASKGT